MTTTATQSPIPSRHWNFWVLAALIGVATAPLAGLIGAALIASHSILGALAAGESVRFDGEKAAMLFSLGLTFALPLAPITAICVPLAYRFAAREPRHGRLTFMVLGAFAGLIAPILVGGLVSLAAWNNGPVTIGAIYGLLGLILAPLCAVLIWPILRATDELAVK